MPVALSPQMGAAEKMSLALSLDPALDIAADGLYTRPPNITTSVTNNFKESNKTAELGYSKSIWEVSAGAYPGKELQSIGIYLQGKLQLLGARGMITSPDWFLSIYGRFGAQKSSNKGDQKVIFGGGGYPWTGEADMTFTMGGLSIGKKFGDLFIFIGGAYESFPVNVKSVQGPADDNSDPGGAYEKSFAGFASSGGLGLEYYLNEIAWLGAGGHYINYDYNGIKNDFVMGSAYFKVSLDVFKK
jgi:hypothetical protein